jgi:hypothetical protein
MHLSVITAKLDSPVKVLNVALGTATKKPLAAIMPRICVDNRERITTGKKSAWITNALFGTGSAQNNCPPAQGPRAGPILSVLPIGGRRGDAEAQLAAIDKGPVFLRLS